MPDAARPAPISGRAILDVTAPVRIADCGGWTDTWFARAGIVCSIAVEPAIRVRLLSAGAVRGDSRLTVAATGDSYLVPVAGPPGRHPLLESVIARYRPRSPLEIVVESAVPAGSGMGTSAAVVVALLAALRAHQASEPDGAEPDGAEPAALAAEAHGIETRLGLQSGVQDQFAAAFGRIGRITVDYPHGQWHEVPVRVSMMARLERQLLTVYLGRPHMSSSVHDLVIARLQSVDDAEPWLAPLRNAAERAAIALSAGDLVGFGAALNANTDAQAALHPDLISDDARRLAKLARRHGALGLKVNGAGGEGGTVTILTGDDPAPLRSVIASTPGLTVLDLRIAGRGVTVTSPPTGSTWADWAYRDVHP